jgi:hypothetical protein
MKMNGPKQHNPEEPISAHSEFSALSGFTGGFN